MKFTDGQIERTVDAVSEGDGYRAGLHEYGSDAGSCAGKWHWRMEVGAVVASGILPTRAMAEQACRDSLEILRETNGLITDLVAEIKDPQTSGTCSSCDGSGEGRADGTRCSTCKGIGEVAL